MLGSRKIMAVVPSRDAEKAKSFYEGVLGLRFVSEDQFAGVLDANGIMVRVTKVPEFKPQQLQFWDGKFRASRKRCRACKKEG